MGEDLPNLFLFLENPRNKIKLLVTASISRPMGFMPGSTCRWVKNHDPKMKDKGWKKESK